MRNSPKRLPIAGCRLSHSAKERIEKYYKGFSVCEHPLNRGDLTPFVISFSELIVDAMEGMLDSLWEKQSDLVDAVDAVNRAIATEEEDAGPWRVAFILAQAALFSENGATTEELCATVGMSEPTMAKKRKRIKELGFCTRRTRTGKGSIRWIWGGWGREFFTERRVTEGRNEGWKI